MMAIRHTAISTQGCACVQATGDRLHMPKALVPQSSARVNARFSSLSSSRSSLSIRSTPSDNLPAESKSLDPATVEFPSSPERQVEQAVAAILGAYREGKKEQRVEILLPLIGATDLDDWPGGIQQQFKAAVPLVEEILKQVKKEPGLEGQIVPRFLDKGDAVCLWESSGVSCVLFPTGATLPTAIDAAEKAKLMLVINPQWNEGGIESANLISDFGFGGRRKRCEEFIKRIGEETFYCKQIRIQGENLKVIRRYPEAFKVIVNTFEGETFVLSAKEDKRPSYKRLEELAKARPGSVAAMDFVERLKYEIEWSKRDGFKSPDQ